ncbi:HD domain-containing protein [Neolewinella persica]|uniref:HD domain-containing protein n=1 Tax=Neolewinella persica TaxID=70998 RepID=UPI00039B22C9|nr:HD domain-containing protein [Neolewinella persica]
MKKHRESIVYRAGNYVVRLLREQLPANRVFHNVHHTINVVQGVVDIGREEKLGAEDMEILMLAAWFHDTGHVYTYAGHEDRSIMLAQEWLRGQAYPEARTAEVVRCIRATTMPQQPTDLLEMVICDADLYHLSFPTYDHYQELLREEWKLLLGIDMTDEEWRNSNDAFLRNHHYWTEFGQERLEGRKLWE